MYCCHAHTKKRITMPDVHCTCIYVAGAILPLLLYGEESSRVNSMVTCLLVMWNAFTLAPCGPW